MKDETYEGWANIETWIMEYWLRNESSMYGADVELARVATDFVTSGKCEAVQAGTWTVNEGIIFTLEDMLRDWIDELVDSLQDKATVFTELRDAAVTRVNWKEIAEAAIQRLEEAQ